MAATDEVTLRSPDFAQEFAAFSANLTLAAMPPEAIAAVKTNLYDTLACAVAGTSASGVADLTALIKDWGGKTEACVWGSRLRVPAHHAAWVNGMMSHARDFDDTHDGATLHAGVSVVPAALAAAEAYPEATGEDLLAGIAVGLELICRLGVATKVGIIASGYMYTSLFGHFAATAAAARVARLDPAQTLNALGIAYSQAAGNHQVTRDAALTKRIQPGFAAKTGLISVAMSRAGIRGAQKVFEGADGLFRTYLHRAYDADRLREGLGTTFDLVDLSYKPYPCCRFNHPPIDAALALRDAVAEAGQIRRIIVGVNRQSLEAVGTPIEMRRNPQTIVQAQFSIPYTVACALTKGTLTLSDFTDEGLKDKQVLDLAARVDVVLDDEIEKNWARAVSPATLVIETAGGRFETRVDYPKGHFSAPMSVDDFQSKMRGCMAISGIDWPAGMEAALHAAVDGLETGVRPAEIIALVTPR